MHKFNEVQLQLSELKAEKAVNVSTLPLFYYCSTSGVCFCSVMVCVHGAQYTHLQQLCHSGSHLWMLHAPTGTCST
jgi:hypothetical protein